MRSVLDLFSCIGGHAIGLHATGGFRTLAFVESDPWRRSVLAHHFPDVPRFDDVRTFHPWCPADMVVGGPPCQHTSLAAAVHGGRTGESLWPEMKRIIHEAQARWVVVEQPPGHSAWENAVKGDLEGTGYHVSRHVISAASLGAPHLRRRVFLLANRYLSRLQIAGRSVPREIERISRGTADRNPWCAGFPGTVRVADGVPGRLDRRRRIQSIGDSNPPVMMSVIGHAILNAEKSP